MISLLGSNHSQIYHFHSYHSQIYHVYHYRTCHYYSQQTLSYDLPGQTSQSSTYQIRSLQTSSHSNDVGDLDDDEYGDDGRYKLDSGNESGKEVVDIAFQDQYGNET
jgi:hypothetical protein